MDVPFFSLVCTYTYNTPVLYDVTFARGAGLRVLAEEGGGQRGEEGGEREGRGHCLPLELFLPPSSLVSSTLPCTVFT